VLQHRHQLKAVTPALVGATEEQLAAKVCPRPPARPPRCRRAGSGPPLTAPPARVQAAHAAKLLQELPGALQGEMRRAVADAKGALGMPGYDASRIEAQLRSVLQAENGAAPSSAPGGAPPAAHPARPGRDDAGEGGGAQAAAARGAKRAHAATRPDAAHEVHPKRRIDLIKELEAQLAHIYHRTRALEQAAAQAEARRAEAAQENESLWALTTHIHTAIAVALAERRAQAAAAPRAVPAPPPPAPPPPPPATQQRQPEAGGQVPQSGGLPRMTPGNGLAALFSPDGDDLFAACNMFISPADRALAAQPGDKPRKLFGEETAGPGEPPAPPAGAL
jgi:hypothetical protein